MKQKKSMAAAANWNQTRCNPGPDLSPNPVVSTIAPPTSMQRVPHFGPFLSRRLRRNPYRIRTVDHLLRYCVRAPNPYSTNQLHTRISKLLRNPRRNTCSRNSGGARRGTFYQVSDVNQCAFNSVVKLLRHAHTHWAGYNIPNAQHLRYRKRGNNRRVRECACQSTRRRCRNFGGVNSGLCTWTPSGNGPNGTRFPNAYASTGACTPTQHGQQGFRGQSAADQYNQRTMQVNNTTRAQRAGNLNDGGGWYVRRWRVPTPRRRGARRRRRRGSARRLHACGTGGPVAATAAVPMAPNPAWSDRTNRAWARAVVDRFRTPPPRIERPT